MARGEGPHDAVVELDGRDYFIEQVGPDVWVTEDGDVSVLVFSSTSQAEVHGAMKLLATSGQIARAAFRANDGVRVDRR